MDRILWGVTPTMETVRGILENACQKAFPGQITDRIPVRADCRNGLGVFSSSLPFAAAKQMRTSPLHAAKAILAQTEPSELFGSVKAQSGYLNFFPSDLWYQKSAEALFSAGDFDPRFTEEDLPPLAAASPTDRAVLQTFLRLCSRLRHLRFLGYSHGERPLEGDFGEEEKLLLFSLCRLAELPGSYPVLTETAQLTKEFLDLVLPRTDRETALRAELFFAAGRLLHNSIRTQKIADL